jgi:PAS domain S-box-containing protein
MDEKAARLEPKLHYLELFESAPTAYLITDRAGTIEDANGAAVDLFQRRRRQLIGRPLAALIALDQRHAFRSRLRALGAGEADWTSIAEAPGLRLAVKFSARLMPAGICWRAQAQP